MASVYLAEQIGDRGFAKTVAIKAIRRDRLREEKTIAMFVNEARLTADLVHQNILQVYNLINYGGTVFVIMEFLHGVTLTEYQKRHRRDGRQPDIDMCAFIVSRVCRGLYYAHTKKDRSGRPLGVVHRDVTPSNILLDFRGFVKLSDFGIAKALTTDMPDETQVIMGKLPYMSPEQAKAEGTDARSDIYSLGLVLYELLTQHRVYNARNRRELIAMMTKYRVKDPRKLRPEIPDDLAAIVLKALSKDKRSRYQEGREFGNSLEKYMYSDRYGPTNEKLAVYIAQVFPEKDKNRIE